MKQKIKKTITTIKSSFYKYKFLIKPILIFFTLYLIIFIGIILANFNYIDDLGRAMYGYTKWENFGRYTSVSLSHLIHTDTFLADISPLGQLIAIFFLSIASTLSIFIITKKKKFTISHYITGILIGASPYFLECISYKFDSPYMALSILVSILPFLFYKKEKNWLFYIISFICGIIMCTTYQASSGIYFVLAIILAFSKITKQQTFKSSLKDLIKQFLPFIIAIIFFKVVIMSNITGEEYVSSQLPSIQNFLPNFFTNLYAYYKNIFHDFRTIWIAIISIISLLFIITPAIKYKKPSLFIISLVTIITIAMVMFGLYPALTTPLFTPRAMYGCCVALSFVCIYLADIIKYKFLNIPTYIIAWCFIVTSFIYGNTLSNQLRWADFRMQNTINNLTNNNIITSQTKSIAIKGDIGTAPDNINSIQNFPILQKLIPNLYNGNGGWTWGTYRFCEYFNLNIETCTANTDYNINNNKTIDNYYETIKYNNQKIVIELK